VPAAISIPVNDLTVTVQLAELIRHAERSQQHNAHSKNGSMGSIVAASPIAAAGASVVGLQTLLSGSGASTLEMQISAFCFTQVMHKRLCDALPMMIRFHLLRALTHSPATPTALANANPQSLLSAPQLSLSSLSSLLQRAFIDMADKALVECMKEEPSTAAKRDSLNKAIARMERAMTVFDAL
jgi:hypothetical protein